MSDLADAGIVAILRVVPEAAFLLDAEGRVRYANPRAVRELGWSVGADVTHLRDRVVDPIAFDDYLRLTRRVGDLLPGGVEFRLEDRTMPRRCQAARLIDLDEVLVVLFVTPREADNPSAVLTEKLSQLTREVRRRAETEDELRRSETQLQDRILEAERLSRAKDEFLATVSHELRTPLQSILGWSRMLSSGQLDAAQTRRGLETIERNALAQAKLIDDLLDVSRIIAGKLRLEIQLVDPELLVRAAIDSLRPAIEAKQLRLETILDPGAGPIFADPPRVQQVAWNLLSNAVKFTPKGGRIRLLLRRVESHIEIEVSDNGRGIPADFMGRLFHSFTQADASSSRSQGGLGLGLAICRHLVELHGGAIEASSDGPGLGATFRVRLPRASIAAPQRRPAVEESPAMFECTPELDGLSVLVIDDEADARDLVAEVLTQCGCTVRTAGSVREGLALVAQALPRVILSDIGMPAEDGYVFIRELRSLSRERGGTIPVAALTAYASSEDRRRVLLAGFQMHVPKPVDPAELVAIVSSLARTAADLR